MAFGLAGALVLSAQESPLPAGSININFPDDQRSGSANLVLNLQMLKLEKHGEYSIDLAVDGRDEASLPLFVREKR